MDLQKEKFPEHQLPWVVSILTDAVLQLKGPQTEGIFRYCVQLWLVICLFLRTAMSNQFSLHSSLYVQIL